MFIIPFFIFNQHLTTTIRLEFPARVKEVGFVTIKYSNRQFANTEISTSLYRRPVMTLTKHSRMRNNFQNFAKIVKPMTTIKLLTFNEDKQTVNSRIFSRISSSLYENSFMGIRITLLWNKLFYTVITKMVIILKSSVNSVVHR